MVKKQLPIDRWDDVTEVFIKPDDYEKETWQVLYVDYLTDAIRVLYEELWLEEAIEVCFEFEANRSISILSMPSTYESKIEENSLFERTSEEICHCGRRVCSYDPDVGCGNDRS